MLNLVNFLIVPAKLIRISLRIIMTHITVGYNWLIFLSFQWSVKLTYSTCLSYTQRIYMTLFQNLWHFSQKINYRSNPHLSSSRKHTRFPELYPRRTKFSKPTQHTGTQDKTKKTCREYFSIFFEPIIYNQQNSLSVSII